MGPISMGYPSTDSSDRNGGSIQIFAIRSDPITVRWFICLPILFLTLEIARPQQKVPGSPAAGMQESLAQQRLSVEKQLRAISSASFFALPPPAPIDQIAPAGSAECDPVPEAELQSMIEETAKRESIRADLLRS